MKEAQQGKNQDDSSDRNQRKSPTNKKPLTPTKLHPLMDLEISKTPRNEFIDYSDDPEDDVVHVMQSEESKSDDVDLEATIIDEFDETSQEPDNHQVATMITSLFPDDEANNNNRREKNQVEVSDSKDDVEKGKSEEFIKSKSSSITNNNGANVKNNNRMSYPIGHDPSQPTRTEDLISKSTEKLDGKFKDLLIDNKFIYKFLALEEITESMTQKQTELPLPLWVLVGESVLIRPYNTSGVIGFVGPTHFQV